MCNIRIFLSCSLCKLILINLNSANHFVHLVLIIKHVLLGKLEKQVLLVLQVNIYILIHKLLYIVVKHVVNLDVVHVIVQKNVHHV